MSKLNTGSINKSWYGTFFACGIWCVADVSSVSPSSEQTDKEMIKWRNFYLLLRRRLWSKYRANSTAKLFWSWALDTHFHLYTSYLSVQDQFTDASESSDCCFMDLSVCETSYKSESETERQTRADLQDRQAERQRRKNKRWNRKHNGSISKKVNWMPTYVCVWRYWLFVLFI